MEYLMPALKVLHVFGLIMWMGAVVIQYVYLSAFFESDQLQPREYALALARRINKTLLNTGWILMFVSGIAMVYIYGMEWIRFRFYIQLKLVLAIVAIGMSHAALGQLKKAYAVYKKDGIGMDDEKTYQQLIGKWKIFSAITIALLALIIILMTFRFGF
ncbi:DUF2269 family protein [bacterium]|nr:DUF2269 family protein [bacterium]